MRRITLREYQVQKDVRLSPSERDALLASPARINCAPSPGQEGHYDLMPTSIVGVIHLGAVAIEIRPKIAVPRLLLLLSYALGRRKMGRDLFRFESQKDLFETIVESFVHLVQKAVRRGILSGYHGEEDALNSIRGRLRFGDQLRKRFGRFPPAEVTYDEYSEDIELNRLLKSALDALLRLPLRSEKSRRLLHTHLLLLERVRLVAYDPRRLPEIGFNRLNEHYRPAVELAKFILKHVSFEASHGAITAPSFLIDMNGVFEDFLVEAVREKLKLTPLAFPQGARHKALALDTMSKIVLKPDLSWWEEGRCVFVGDAKYKRMQEESAHNQDLYQLLAYATATDLPGGLLVYADGDGTPIRHRVRHADRELHVRSIDLGGSPEELLDEVEKVAALIQDLKQRAIERACSRR